MLILRLILALTLIVPLAACDKHAKDKKEIQSSWGAYRDAAKNGDGATAAGLMSKSTIDFYARLVKLAPDATSSQCMALKPTEMVQVADLREHYTRKELANLSGEAYIARSIKEGRWGTYDPTWRLKNIVVSTDGATATATICDPDAESDYRQRKLIGTYNRTARRMNRGTDAPPTFPAAFVKVGDIWKYDETVTLADQDKDLMQAARDEGLQLHQYVAANFTDAIDPKDAVKIWQPMKK